MEYRNTYHTYLTGSLWTWSRNYDLSLVLHYRHLFPRFSQLLYSFPSHSWVTTHLVSTHSRRRPSLWWDVHSADDQNDQVHYFALIALSFFLVLPSSHPLDFFLSLGYTDFFLTAFRRDTHYEPTFLSTSPFYIPWRRTNDRTNEQTGFFRANKTDCIHIHPFPSSQPCI